MKKYDGYNSSVIHFGFVQKFMDKAIILYYYLIVRRIANNILFDLISFCLDFTIFRKTNSQNILEDKSNLQ